MGVRRYQDLFTWQLANSFNESIRRSVAKSPEARKDHKFRGQLLDASRAIAPNIAEGFARYSPAQFRQFLDYALGSLAEAETRFSEGVASGYFSERDAAEVTHYAKRCATALVRLKQSQRSDPPHSVRPGKQKVGQR